MAKAKKNKFKKIKKELKKDKLMCLELVISLIVLVFVLTLVVLAICCDKHTVTFNTNGGNVITSKKVLHNKRIKEPTEPVRDGYSFLGWYYNGEKYSFDQEVTENIELSAKWEKIVYSNIEEIEIPFDDFAMKPNTSVKIKTNIKPEVDEEIYWKSSDDKVVEVDGNGLLTSKKEGSATITASTIKGLSDEINITVSNDAISLDSISLVSELIITKGSIKKLEIEFSPINVSNKNIIWTSDNTNIVSVDKDGVITAKSEGTAYVFATTLDGSKVQKCQITVILN